MNDDRTEDLFLGGQLRLCQPKSGHRAGHDAMLLAAATSARPGDLVVEFGAGVGAAGLAVARRTGGITLVLVEFDEVLARLARDNAVRNAIDARVLEIDAASPGSAYATVGVPPGSADVVLMNPPFNDRARHRASPDPSRASAHMAEKGTLERWVDSARRLLKTGGALTLIWRADAIAEVLAALGRGFGSLAIQPVHADAARPAIRVLVRAIRGGKAPARLLAGAMLNDESGLPNKELAEILAGKGVLRLATS